MEVVFRGSFNRSDLPWEIVGVQVHIKFTPSGRESWEEMLVGMAAIDGMDHGDLYLVSAESVNRFSGPHRTSVIAEGNARRIGPYSPTLGMYGNHLCRLVKDLADNRYTVLGMFEDNAQNNVNADSVELWVYNDGSFAVVACHREEEESLDMVVCVPGATLEQAWEQYDPYDLMLPQRDSYWK